MPANRSLGVPQITGETLEDVKQSTQWWLQHVFNNLDSLSGLRGNAKFFGDLDVNDNAITNLKEGRAKSNDAATVDQSLTKNGNAFDAETLPITNLPPGSEGTDAANVAQLKSEVEVASAALAATIADLRADLETLRVEGTFTVTGTGFVANPTATARYVKVGKLITLYIPTLTGTSNATAFTLTGLPVALTPTRNAYVAVRSADNGVELFRLLEMVAASAVLTLYPALPPVAGAWTAAGVKALFDTMLTYVIV